LAAFVRRRVFNDELKMTDSQILLADYVETGSETAFRELVLSYINSTAMRSDSFYILRNGMMGQQKPRTKR
jgi:hypothetical protein